MDYLPIFTPTGAIWVPATDLEWWERSNTAVHKNALVKWLGTNDDSLLEPFVGGTIGGYPLASTPDEVEQLDEAAAFDFDQFYWDGIL